MTRRGPRRPGGARGCAPERHGSGCARATSAPAAILGALLGLAIAIGLGWGIYAGGLRLNLKMFFQVTGVFLVFVAVYAPLFLKPRKA